MRAAAQQRRPLASGRASCHTVGMQTSRTRGRLAPFLFAAALALGALAPRPAHAVALSLGAGGHYWLAERAVFHADVLVRQPLAGPLSVGGRFGVLLTASDVDLGIPIDLVLRLDFGRVYVEAVGGPWIFLEAGRVVPHVAGGFGLVAGNLTFGPEVGWLDPHAIVGARLTYRL